MESCRTKHSEGIKLTNEPVLRTVAGRGTTVKKDLNSLANAGYKFRTGVSEPCITYCIYQYQRQQVVGSGFGLL